MKKKLYIGLAITAILCVIGNLTQFSVDGLFTSILAAPFEQIAFLLRKLSMTGKFGNGLACLLFVECCLIPIQYLLAAKRSREYVKEDWLLVLMSILLGVVLYLMINPGEIAGMSYLLGADQTIGKAILGGVIYSVFTGYVILRIVRMFFHSESWKLYQYLNLMLALLSFLYVILIFGSGLGGLIANIESVKSQNTDPSVQLELTYVVLVIRYVCDILPYALNLVTIALAGMLLSAMQIERYSDDTVWLADQLARWCKTNLCIVVLSSIGMNLLYLILSSKIVKVDSNLLIPVDSVLFVLAVLLFARMISENHDLKDDMELFI